ncbi:hypothetical protein [Nonomuraea sp. NPDC050202]|jgi:hypothetical protein|uniref:hypothetical protein n=1 Tax=Nonomuraea sp. NPDC050202 TaxID=3155035 RepID=UPI0034010BF2
MRTELNRRSLLSRGGTLAPLVGLGLLGGTTAAAADTDTGESRLSPLLGTWAVQVTFAIPNRPGESGLFAFTADRICVATTTGAGHLSLGSWRTTAQGFEFTFRHFMYADDDGSWIGEVRVQQAGRFTSAASWTASGTGTAFDTEGNQLQVVQSATAGTRY